MVEVVQPAVADKSAAKTMLETNALDFTDILFTVPSVGHAVRVKNVTAAWLHGALEGENFSFNLASPFGSLALS